MTDLNNGERQVAPTIAGIRRDHVARYEWAARLLPNAGRRVVDAACGVGYGAQLLAAAGHSVTAIDRSAMAIAYAREFYPHERVTYVTADVEAVRGSEPFDAAVCFETIEHLEDPRAFLTGLAEVAPLLIASVPNEDRFPFRSPANSGQGWAHHHRHYTRAEFDDLLRSTGWEVTGWYGQDGPESDVEAEVVGRTLVVTARRLEAIPVPADQATTIAATSASQSAVDSEATRAAPRHVVILGLGSSLATYIDVVKRLGNRRVLADEVWAVNGLGDLVQCDRIFHMDDVRVQEIRAAAAPQSNVAAMLGWIKSHPGPIYTSRARSGYPGLVEYPLEAVLNSVKMAYFNSTVAYAVALAIHIGVGKISFFGVDYTYPNAHHAEKGRACVEFWIGVAHSRGIEVMVAEDSTLLDAFEPDQRSFYGYDLVAVNQTRQADGSVRVDFVPKETVPTAAAIEAMYDHSVHPHAPTKG